MNSIRTFQRGKEFYRSLEDEIKHAKKEILINVYSFQDDIVGEKLLALLKKKMEQNVAVKIILDGLGSRHDGKGIAWDLRAYGGVVKIFRPRGPYPYRHPLLFVRRDHARIFLIDRKIFGVGGMCIGKIYNDREDISVLLKISDTRLIVSYFEHLWACADNDGAKAATPMRHSASSPIAKNITVLISTPNKQEQRIYKWFLERIKKAEKRIVIVSAWFLPTAELLSTLVAAKERGVEVTIITPFHTDKKRYDEFRGAAIPRLLDEGIVWHGAREYFHQKFSIIDDEWCLGSANFDMISMNRNYELNICGRGGTILRELEDSFNKLLTTSGPITKDSVLWFIRRFGIILYPILELFIVTK
jgi:cardiolipin synthase